MRYIFAVKLGSPGKDCTVVDLSTRTAFLNICQSLQFRSFWSQRKALFMIRCMLSAGSGSKTTKIRNVIINPKKIFF